MTPTNTMRQLICIVLLLAGTCADLFAQWDPNYSVATSSGKYAFNYNQTPDALVQVVGPMGSLPSDIVYEWQQCNSPIGTFVAMPSGGQPGYVFSAPLTQTTYFRQKVSFNNGRNIVYSNIIKLQLVSVGWEDANYLREHTIRVQGITDWEAADQLPIGQQLVHTSYSDGMGRPVQTIDAGMATPDPSQPNGVWGDVVQFSSYDQHGRQPAKYLGYTTTAEPGAMKTDPESEANQYYLARLNETSPYVFTTFDNSPMSREVNIKSPGTSWAAGLGKSITYYFNDPEDNVQIWSIGTNGGDIPVSKGAYPANALYKTIHTDENNKQIIVYADMEGKQVLVKEQLEDNPSVAHSGWICTYTIYDDFGRARCQIQPEGVKWLDGNGWTFSVPDGQTVLYNYCFRYEYDEKGRMTLKKMPGADDLFKVYDKRDRLVFTQDGNQRVKSPNEWQAYLYDELDRVVLTALYETSKSRGDLQTDIDNATAVSTIAVPGQVTTDLVVSSRAPNLPEYVATHSIEFDPVFETGENDAFETSLVPAGTGVSESLIVYNSPVPASVISDPTQFVPLTYTYYDNYNFPGAKPFDNGYNNALASSSSDPAAIPITVSQRTMGMVTGTKVRVLGTTTFLSGTTHYDEKGRALQVSKDNLLSGTDITTDQYYFDGRIASSDSRHTTAGTLYSNFDILTMQVYDKIGRMVAIQKKIGSNAFKTIAAYDYDPMGRMLTKHLDPGYTGTGRSELESLTYSYNIHEKVTGINKDYALKTPGKYDKWGNFFGQCLGFDNRDGTFSSGRLDGKIAGSMWSTQGDDAQRKYEYSYDNAGRVTNAVFRQKLSPDDAWSNSTLDFSVSGHNGAIGYDLNGNLQYMLHKGVLPGSPAPYVVDDLQYSYTRLTNRLASVTDGGNLGVANGTLGDFADGSNGTADDYVYDRNGNLVVDLNKHITQLPGAADGSGISYNSLDKPEQINIQGKGIVRIIYDAAGNQLQRVFTPSSGGAAVTTTYINAFVYQGTTLQSINFEEGRIRVMQAYSNAVGPDYLTLDGNLDLPGGQRGAYDFFVRDFQGNVRMILTEETHQGSNACTMETARDGVEAPLFGQVDANGTPTANNEVRVRFKVQSIPGQTTGGGWQNPAIGDYVSRVGTYAGSTMGPNALLRVMGGDRITAFTQYYYAQPIQQVSGSAVVNDLVTALGSALLQKDVTTSLVHSGAGNITQNLGNQLGGNSFVDPGGLPSSPGQAAPPYAWLYILFFDEQMNFVQDGSRRIQVSEPDAANATLTLPNVQAPNNGYAFVYVCNGSDPMVYFDNFQVTLAHGAILEEDHYYTYGLKIAAISSQALPDPHEGTTDNNYLYNGKQLMPDANLDWYNYGYRNYDPQIGRFVQLDPLSSSFPYLSPYQYAGCDPVLNVDLDGLEPMLPTVVVTHVEFTAGISNALVGQAINFILTDGTRFLGNFGNNAVIYAYLGSNGEVAWFLDHPADNRYYHYPGSDSWEGFSYIGKAQISAPPSEAEQMAAAMEKAYRHVHPMYGVAMGVVEEAKDMVMGILNIANMDPKQNTLANLLKFAAKSDVEKAITVYNAISHADWEDPTTYGRGLLIAVTVAVPVVNEAGIAGDAGALGSEAAALGDAAEAGEGAAAVSDGAAAASDGQALDGSFSIWNWDGYPAELPKPEGPFRLLKGEEYSAARKAADKINDATREANNMRGVPYDIHELQPVKFGGSPTDPLNKIGIPKDLHSDVTQWWNALQRDVEPYTF